MKSFWAFVVAKWMKITCRSIKTTPEGQDTLKKSNFVKNMIRINYYYYYYYYYNCYYYYYYHYYYNYYYYYHYYYYHYYY